MVHTLTTLFVVTLTVALQSPDSTWMNLSVGAGDGVPTTTIIPVAEPPIREVDTTYIRTTPPDSVHRHRHRGHSHRPSRCPRATSPQQNIPKNESR